MEHGKRTEEEEEINIVKLGLIKSKVIGISNSEEVLWMRGREIYVENKNTWKCIEPCLNK